MLLRNAMLGGYRNKFTKIFFYIMGFPHLLRKVGEIYSQGGEGS